VLLIGMLVVSSSSILIRLAQNEGAPSLVISAWRLVGAMIVLTPIVLTRHVAELRSLNRRQIGLALLSGAMLSIHFASWITSLEYTSVITSVVLVTTNPLWVALLSPLFLREKLNLWTFIAIVFAMLGGIFVSIGGGAGSAPRQDAPALGAVLAMIGAISVALYFMIGRSLRASISILPYIWLTYGSAAIVLTIIVLFSGQQVTGLPTDAYFWMTLCALGPQLIGHSSYNYALGFLSATFVSLTVLFEPVISTILAMLFLNEQPAPVQIVAGFLILYALLNASREERVKQAEIEEAGTL
jgi:drug/metabolite transporter (DMT)-like permease